MYHFWGTVRNTWSLEPVLLNKIDLVLSNKMTPIKKKSKNNEYDARENVETEEQSHDGFKISKNTALYRKKASSLYISWVVKILDNKSSQKNILSQVVQILWKRINSCMIARFVLEQVPTVAGLGPSNLMQHCPHQWDSYTIKGMHEQKGMIYV